jgi:hypothetical protein
VRESPQGLTWTAKPSRSAHRSGEWSRRMAARFTSRGSAGAACRPMCNDGNAWTGGGRYAGLSNHVTGRQDVGARTGLRSHAAAASPQGGRGFPCLWRDDGNFHLHLVRLMVRASAVRIFLRDAAA